MERAAPVRSSHTSTAGLLAWPHPDGAGSLPARRPNQVTRSSVPPPPAPRGVLLVIVVDLLLFLARLQPTEEFRNVVFGGQLTEGADGLNKTKR